MLLGLLVLIPQHGIHQQIGDAPALTDDQIAAGSYYVWNESNYQSDPATAWVLTTPE